MDVKKMVYLFVERHGMDGLCNAEFECGCGLDDFAPCIDGPYPDCVMARKHILPESRMIHTKIAGETMYFPYAEPGDEVFIEADK